jgi:hypothetical protein
MSRVRLLRTGGVLHLIGNAPKNAGDKFRASASPLPVAEKGHGCTVTPLADGAAFVCSRGTSARRAEPVRDYRFDPALHELIP